MKSSKSCSPKMQKPKGAGSKPVAGKVASGRVNNKAHKMVRKG